MPENLEKIVHLLRQAQEGFQGFKVPVAQSEFQEKEAQMDLLDHKGQKAMHHRMQLQVNAEKKVIAEWLEKMAPKEKRETRARVAQLGARALEVKKEGVEKMETKARLENLVQREM